MVAEPKPHQTGRKRQNMAKTGNDWDYYYDSYYASAGFGAGRLVPPLKRPRLLVNTPTRPVKSTAAKLSSSPSQVKTYSNPDILICGNCREMFTELQDLLDHKKEFCKLRFTCKCSMLNGSAKDVEEGVNLTCVQCKEPFSSAWDLMVHVQAAHMLNIYELAPKEDRFNNHENDHKDCEDVEIAGQGSDDDLSHENHDACLVGAISIETTNGDTSPILTTTPVINGEIKASSD